MISLDPLTFICLLAFLLDQLLGDPKSWPHPVNGIARFAKQLEFLVRQHFAATKLSGLLVAVIVYLTVAGTAYLSIYLTRQISSWLVIIVSIWLIYVSIAAKSLFDHVKPIITALEANDLINARVALSQIVGRDTAELSSEEIAKATIESLAESLVDGITAPLFWAFIFGPIGAIVYRAVNTLDSLFGHKDDKYINFGLISARVDDSAGFIPARLSALLLILASRNCSALTIWRRDRNKHASPNSGQTEAAMAGALGVELGGLRYYDGIADHAANLGDANVSCDIRKIKQACQLVKITSWLFLIAGIAFRKLVV